MNRTQALCVALDWQGGTIHQICQEIGCTVDDILYRKPLENSVDYCVGYHRGRVKRMPMNSVLVAEHAHNLQYWIGVAEGIIARNL